VESKVMENWSIEMEKVEGMEEKEGSTAVR
jgi:hypothetical protein